jgi:nitroreductase/predicted lactoylglutathione lyase
MYIDRIDGYIGGAMSGIVFFKTRMPDELKEFYTSQVGCEIWLEQADCFLFRHGNMILGFHQQEDADTDAMITFFYESKDAVDQMYDKFKDVAESKPTANAKYRIYHFFARDPEGRTIEFQWFDHPVESHFMGDELLLTRRSHRKYEPVDVSQDTLDQLLELCRFAPTSVNSQSYYFRIIRDRQIIDNLSGVRDRSSSPIRNAPMAVAICADPALSRRHIQDGCIAAYHFMLAAWCFGLGTCWIAAMDRDDVKEMLNIPPDHYVATVTPLGYPLQRTKPAPDRKDVSWFLRENR